MTKKVNENKNSSKRLIKIDIMGVKMQVPVEWRRYVETKETVLVKIKGRKSTLTDKFFPRHIQTLLHQMPNYLDTIH